MPIRAYKKEKATDREKGPLNLFSAIKEKKKKKKKNKRKDEFSDSVEKRVVTTEYAERKEER